MADQITYNNGAVVTIAISNTYDLQVQPIKQEVAEVNIEISNFAFIRNDGYSFRRAVAKGRETFTTLALAQDFVAKIVDAVGRVCTLEHDTLAPSDNLVTIACVSHNLPHPMTNKYPGFHLDWEMNFSEPYADVAEPEPEPEPEP